MTRHIGEGTIDVPKTWHNASVNIFTAEPPGRAGPSVSVNRDLIRPGMTLASYTSAQIEQMRSKFSDFKMAGETNVMVDGRPAILYEFSWLTHKGAVMHQIMLTIADHDRLLNIVASHGATMERTLREQMRATLLSFRFAS